MSVERARPLVALAGIGLAVAAVFLENTVVVWGAIGVLAVAFLLRFFLPGTASSARDTDAPLS